MPGVVPAPALDDLRHALDSLALTLPEGAISDTAAFAEVACTLAEEIDHTHTFSYDLSATPAASAAAAVDLAASRGFVGDRKDRVAVLDFLAAEAQAARLSAHAGLATARARAAECEDGDGDGDVIPGKGDVVVAAAVSSMCDALGFVVEDAEKIETVDQFVEVVEKVGAGMGRMLEEAGGIEALGEVAIGEETVEAVENSVELMAEAEEICRALAAEYGLRKRLLFRRLEVTVRSFNYSERANEFEFERILRGVKRAVEQGEREVSVFDALVARDWILEMERVSGREGEGGKVASDVKKVLMGSVPDRGGRVGSAAALKANMPAFRARQEGGGGGQGRGRGRARNSKGRGKGSRK